MVETSALQTRVEIKASALQTQVKIEASALQTRRRESGGEFFAAGPVGMPLADSSGSPQAGGVGEAYADGATGERPGALAEHTGGRGL
jgi:hypothetical protein